MPEQQQPHPMQPTDEQLSEWLNVPPSAISNRPITVHRYRQIYQAGADAQLEAVKVWLAGIWDTRRQFPYTQALLNLQAAMRPAPPNMRELRDAGLEALDELAFPGSWTLELRQERFAAIRAALEAMLVEPEAKS